MGENSIAHYQPISGTLSLVLGMASATIFRKTVNESRIVTPRYWRKWIDSVSLVLVLVFDLVVVFVEVLLQI